MTKQGIEKVVIDSNGIKSRLVINSNDKNGLNHTIIISYKVGREEDIKKILSDYCNEKKFSDININENEAQSIYLFAIDSYKSMKNFKD